MFGLTWEDLFSFGSQVGMIVYAIMQRQPHMVALGFGALVKHILLLAGADPANKFDKYPRIMDELATAIMADIADAPALIKQ